MRPAVRCKDAKTRTHRKRAHRQHHRPASGRGRHRRGAQQPARPAHPQRPRRRTRRPGTRGHRPGSRRDQRPRRGLRPGGSLPEPAGRATGRQDRPGHPQLLPAPRRPHPRTRLGLPYQQRAGAAAPGRLARGEGVQHHLLPAPARPGPPRRCARPQRPAGRRRRPGRPPGGHAAAGPAGLGHRRRGPLPESWRFQPDTPAYGLPYMAHPDGEGDLVARIAEDPGAPAPAERIRAALAAA